MIHYTVDIDWAPEEVIQDTVTLFNEYKVSCSFFATHKSEALAACDRTKFEVGLHPNFNYLIMVQGGDPDAILDDLIEIYPEAKGIRSHSLTQNSWLLTKFKEKKMLYELNNFLPYYTAIRPFYDCGGILRIPFNWEDDYHFLFDYSFDSSRIDEAAPGLNIFNFHPIHIFLNTESIDRYLAVKDNMSDVNLLLRSRNKGPAKGVRDFLLGLLEKNQKQPTPSLRMIDIYQKFKDGTLDIGF